MLKRIALGTIYVLLLTRAGSSQTVGIAPAQPIDYDSARRTRVVRAARTTSPVVIDGHLDETAWKTGDAATTFVQVQPHTGEPATEQTEVRILYDDAYLYVGAICFDSRPEAIRINTLEEDFESGNTDMFGFVLDTLNDGQSGFEFFINPAGARHDAQIFRDGELVNIDWDGVWSVATSVNGTGWVAEVVIPLKTLRFSDASEQEWGFNAVRRTRWANEDSTWSPLPLRIRTITRPSWAGRIVGLTGIRQGRNLKIKPFAIASAARFGSAGSNNDADAGVDFKYGVTPSMTLDLTYRTDFSQVEADEQQVNLTRFNLLFPEKREFFLENQGIFNIAATPGDPPNIIPFFSRRIGLSAAGSPIPIVGGGRMSGRTGSYDVGVLAMTADDDGAVPSNSFVVTRVRKNLPNTSTIGAIVTSRDSTVSGDFNRVYGADMSLRVFDKLDIASYVLASDTPDRRDLNQARLLGGAWRGDALTWAAQYEQVQPNFNPEVGFVRRTAMTHYDSEFTWQLRPKDTSRLRHYIVEGGADYYADRRGELETLLQNAGAGFTLQNGAQVVARAQNSFDRLVDPFAIRPNVIIAPGDYEYLRYSVSANSDRSRSINGTITAGTGEFWDGSSNSMRGTVELRPNHHLSVAGTLDYNAVKLPAGNFSTTILGTRVFYGFNSNTFFNSFLQYNATTQQFSANSRFNFIHRPLSDLFVVYNERRDSVSNTLIERALIVKFTNLFDF